MKPQTASDAESAEGAEKVGRMQSLPGKRSLIAWMNAKSPFATSATLRTLR